MTSFEAFCLRVLGIELGENRLTALNIETKLCGYCNCYSPGPWFFVERVACKDCYYKEKFKEYVKFKDDVPLTIEESLREEPNDFLGFKLYPNVGIPENYIVVVNPTTQ